MIFFQTHLKEAPKTVERAASVAISLEDLLRQVATIRTRLPTCMAMEAISTLAKESGKAVDCFLKNG